MTQSSDNTEKLLIALTNKIDTINEKLELYKKTEEQQIESIRAENKVYQESIRAEIKAYQDANKQQLNVSLGVLVTAAIAILVSVIINN